MRKVSVVLAVMLVLVLALSGCSNKAEAAKEPEPEVVEEEVVVEEAEGGVEEGIPGFDDVEIPPELLAMSERELFEKYYELIMYGPYGPYEGLEEWYIEDAINYGSESPGSPNWSDDVRKYYNAFLQKNSIGVDDDYSNHLRIFLCCADEVSIVEKIKEIRSANGNKVAEEYIDRLIDADSCSGLLNQIAMNEVSYFNNPVDNSFDIIAATNQILEIIGEFESKTTEYLQLLGVETEVSTTSSNVEVDDELAGLEVSESFARISGVYVKRDGRLYSISSSTETKISDDYGWDEPADNVVKLYLKGSDYDGVVSMGDVPIVSLEEGDEVISFRNIPISLGSATFYGYSIPVVKQEAYWLIVNSYNSPGDRLMSPYYSNLEIRDKNDELVSDYHNLEQGENYTVSWFVGTDYYERLLAADSYFYSVVNKEEYTVEAQLSKEGYAFYDLSNIPSGLYYVEGGLIRIG